MAIKSNGPVRFSVVNTMTVLVALASVPGDTVAAKLAQPDSSKQLIVGVDQPDRANSASHGQAMERNKPALFYAGVKLVNNARYIEAIDVLNRATTVDPEIGDTHALLAACLAYTGRYKNAEHEFALAEKYGNNYKDFDLERGICAGALKHYKQAANCFNKFIADHPDNNMTIAKHALAIVVNDLLAQPSGNYLSSATKRGVEHWNIGAQALRVYIDETTAPNDQSVTVLKESFNQWSKSPSPIRFVFVNSVKKAQIQCSWTDNKIALGVSDEISHDRLGATKRTTFTNKKSIICSAKILLFNLQNGSFRSREQILAMSRSVALHEIGHALGLGHSDYSFDTMYPFAPPYGLEFPLTSRDLNTVSKLYLVDERNPQVKQF